MKKLIILSIGAFAFAIQNLPAQSLFTTTNDFVGWSSSSLTATPTASVDLDGASVNGLGNTVDPGSAGTPGSLSLVWQSGTYDYIYSPGEQGNALFLSALENASTLTFDYTTPPAGTGNYFSLGLVLNYQSEFDQLTPASTTSLGGGVTQATFNFGAEASKLASQQAGDGGSFTYFQLGVIYNSNYNTATPFNVDGFAVTPAPEPGALALFGLCALGFLKFPGRRG